MPDRASAVRLLRSADPDERQSAFQTISVEIDDALTDEILRIAEGGDAEEIRADALIALGPTIEICGIDYSEDFGFAPELLPAVSKPKFEELVARLRAIHDDPSQPTLVRRRALEVLVRDPQPWQEASIRTHFAAGDRDWKLTAIFAMGYLRGFEKEIRELVETAEGDFLYEAIRAAREQSVEEAGERIVALALSPEIERELRLTAIEAIPWVAPESRDLLEDLTSEDDEEIAMAAEDALNELDTNEMAAGAYDDDDDEDDDD